MWLVRFCQGASTAILIGKPEGRRPLGRLRLNGRTILKTILNGIGFEGG
jgi:hypothetical protein